VDHAIFRAFNMGALGQLKVSGPPNPNVFSGGQPVEAPQPAPAPQVQAPAVPTPIEHPVTLVTPAASAQAGQQVFASICQACHQADGKGIPAAIPPLAGSDFLMADKERAIRIVTHGLTGPVKVNGQTFNSVMPPQPTLSDADVANVLTYVRNSFGNHGEGVSPEEVSRVRGHGNVARN
jgi:nitrite reductase (NO-forming)